MNYSEALEQQARLLRILEPQKAQEMLAHQISDEPDVFGRHLVSSAIRSLKYGQTFYVSPNITSLLGNVTAQNPPEMTLGSEDLPAPTGWCWFDGDLGYRDPREPEARLRCVSWVMLYINHLNVNGVPSSAPSYDGWLTNALPSSWVGIQVIPWYAQLGPSVVSVSPYSGPILGLNATRTTMPERAFNGDLISEHQRTDAMYLSDLFYVLTAFCRQRILVTPSERAERHAAKRALRDGWANEPLIRVVQLRRTERQGYQPSDTAEHRDYSCQWVVRGHWRQQACGEGHKERRPLWITPYVKGPEDKPLKAPRATVFAVAR